MLLAPPSYPRSSLSFGPAEEANGTNDGEKTSAPLAGSRKNVDRLVIIITTKKRERGGPRGGFLYARRLFPAETKVFFFFFPYTFSSNFFCCSVVFFLSFFLRSVPRCFCCAPNNDAPPLLLLRRRYCVRSVCLLLIRSSFTHGRGTRPAPRSNFRYTQRNKQDDKKNVFLRSGERSCVVGRARPTTMGHADCTTSARENGGQKCSTEIIYHKGDLVGGAKCTLKKKRNFS